MFVWEFGRTCHAGVDKSENLNTYLRTTHPSGYTVIYFLIFTLLATPSSWYDGDSIPKHLTRSSLLTWRITILSCLLLLSWLGWKNCNIWDLIRHVVSTFEGFLVPAGRQSFDLTSNSPDFRFYKSVHDWGKKHRSRMWWNSMGNHYVYILFDKQTNT